MKIPVKPTESMYQLPASAHDGDAGADLAAAEAGVIEPGERALVPLGFAVAIPDGFAGLVMPRSGLAVRHGVTVLNAPGLVDSGYRGELRVALINHGSEAFAYEVGDRIAQLVITPVASCTFEVVDDLHDTARGESGFGSTGVSG